MTYVPSAEQYGFSLKLNVDEMHRVLNGRPVRAAVSEAAAEIRAQVVGNVRATASPENAENYVAALFQEDSYSDDYGFQFDGPHSLGSRPVSIVGIPSGEGSNPDAQPPLVVEARHHPLSSPLGVTIGGLAEDIR